VLSTCPVSVWLYLILGCLSIYTLSFKPPLQAHAAMIEAKHVAPCSSRLVSALSDQTPA
jgi:hypothetical protein